MSVISALRDLLNADSGASSDGNTEAETETAAQAPTPDAPTPPAHPKQPSASATVHSESSEPQGAPSDEASATKEPAPTQDPPQQPPQGYRAAADALKGAAAPVNPGEAIAAMDHQTFASSEGQALVMEALKASVSKFRR